MLRLVVFALLLLPGICHGQLVISGAVTPEQIKEAQNQVDSGLKLLKMLEDNTTNMKIGEFMVVERKDKIKSPLRWQWTDWTKQTVAETTDLVKRHPVKAGQEVWIHKVRSGDTEAKDHFFPAQPEPWEWISAEKQGSATLTVMANGDPDKMPVTVSNNKVVIGDPIPIPRPPDPKPVDPIVTPVTGLRVVFVVDPLGKITTEQKYAIVSPKIEAYLKAKCAKDEKGRPAYRTWGKDVEASLDTPSWAKLWEATKPKLGKLPQVCIVSDLKGETFELPENEAALLALLQRFGGA